MDTVYYHTAMSHFRLKQYADARVEFENLQMDYPRSPFVEESHYRLGQMRYLRSNKFHRDQTETNEAVRLLGDYLESYPDGAFADSARHFHTLALEKLAEKEFRNAMFYRKRKEHEAALIYFNSLLAQYPQSKFNSEAVVGMVEALTALRRVEDAREAIEELEMADFSEPLQKRLEMVIFRLNQPIDPAPKNRRARAQQPAEAQPKLFEIKHERSDDNPPQPAEDETAQIPVNNEEEAQSEAKESDAEQDESQTEKAEVEETESKTEQAQTEIEKTDKQPEETEVKQPETKAAEPQKTE